MIPENSEQSSMVRSLIRILVLLFLGSSLIIALLPLAQTIESDSIWSPVLLAEATLLICLAIIVTAAFRYLLQRIAPYIDSNALAQAQFLDALHPKHVDVAIVCSAALSLFLELGIIRWQSTIFEFFAFYKNFSLLACFLGLGLGYSLATRPRIPLLVVLPLLAWQFGFMMLARFGSSVFFQTTPFQEQLAMGLSVANLRRIVALYGLLTIVFPLTALAFMPLGQLCGRLMERRKKLPAYGLNLLGSLLGVLMMLGASFLWKPCIFKG